ncbi:putative signal peptide and transmembrane protein [Rhodopirellula islandica]|uniref:Signal peptide and transmembrane protein n=1 Tax=Rhodopirellula islandica TaxID=595434 RepID=A0A0J1BF16_RHOIS|nr:hypothetical protein [Rhodopirellula islandica]KLU05096.1 putative signal peptide and transmembrane protein [Rhodopirellula islandica]
MISRISSIPRAAITLIEVIFSIGVIMIGLLGLLSVMPLAGGRARDAVSLSVGAEMGDTIAKNVSIRKWLGNGNLAEMSGGNAVGYDFASNQLEITSSGTALPGICIDPLYYAVQGGSSTAFNSYDDSVFPYYVAAHDPLLNPANSDSTWEPPSMFPWSAGEAGSAPRLTRVGLSGASAELARTIIESVNDLVVQQPKDTTIPAKLTGLDSGEMDYGRRIPTGEFSWIATLVPSENSRFAHLSIVVMRNRVADIDFPTVALTPPILPEMNGMSERVAQVTFASGFSGGAGGVVHLTASATTSSELAPNDWVMLSRRLPDSTQVFRWYRVVAVDQEPEEIFAYSNSELETGLAALPTPQTGINRTTEELWRRRVSLDGPDWEFDFTTDPVSDNSFYDNTFATMVQGVVSVTERLVPWTDL